MEIKLSELDATKDKRCTHFKSISSVYLWWSPNAM